MFQESEYWSRTSNSNKNDNLGIGTWPGLATHLGKPQVSMKRTFLVWSLMVDVKVTGFFSSKGTKSESTGTKLFMVRLQIYL